MKPIPPADFDNTAGPLVLIDSREKRPLEFPRLACRVATLATADYSLVGAERAVLAPLRCSRARFGTPIHFCATAEQVESWAAWIHREIVPAAAASLNGATPKTGGSCTGASEAILATTAANPIADYLCNEASCGHQRSAHLPFQTKFLGNARQLWRTQSKFRRNAKMKKTNGKTNVQSDMPIPEPPSLTVAQTAIILGFGTRPHLVVDAIRDRRIRAQSGQIP